MTLENEKEVYNKADVSEDSCEINAYDDIIFQNVIRKRQLDIIFDIIKFVKPSLILDYGCGAGWLSKIISSNGYNVTGVDISESLIQKSKKNIPDVDFLVADCTKLPLDDDKFDLVVGMGILHHLDLENALKELKRVTKDNAYMIFMEPNKFNPPAFIGRKFFPLDIHTEDESAFNPFKLRAKLIKENFEIIKINYLFPFSFALSYIFGNTRIGMKFNSAHLCSIIEYSERLIEKVPIIKYLNSTIVFVLKT